MDWIFGGFVLLCIAVAAYLVAKPLVDAYCDINKKDDEEDIR